MKASSGAITNFTGTIVPVKWNENYQFTARYGHKLFSHSDTKEQLSKGSCSAIKGQCFIVFSCCCGDVYFATQESYSWPVK